MDKSVSAATEKLQIVFLILQTTSVYSLQQWICQMDEPSDCESEELDKYQFTVYWETANEGISIYSEKIESKFLSLTVVLSMKKDKMFNKTSKIFDTILFSQAIS